MVKRLFEEGIKSAVVGVKRQRSLLVLGSFFVLVLIFVGLLAQAPAMQASDSLDHKNSSISEENMVAYLPVVMSPAFLVADFSSCDSTNNLGGIMGAAYVLPDNLVIESYENSYLNVGNMPEDCQVRLEYHINDWGAFWLKLEHADLSEYTKLIFDIKADEDVGVPDKIKIEIKRDCLEVNDGFQCNEIEIYHFDGTTNDWRRNVEVELSEFEAVDWPGFSGIQDWSDIEELVFTFEVINSGPDGAIYLDNIRFGY